MIKRSVIEKTQVILNHFVVIWTSKYFLQCSGGLIILPNSWIGGADSKN